MSFSENWKEYKVGNLVEVNSNSINGSKKDLKYINYLNTGNLNEGQIEELEFFEINDEEIPSRAKRIVQKGDIIYSTVRPKQKHYGIINREYDNLIVSTGFAVLSPDTQTLIPEFLYRYLTQEKVVNYLHNVAETSTSSYPSITPSVIEDLKIKIPSLEEQQKIANILSAFDEKILNNNEMNETLEKMAQAIYKNWFVDFEPFQDVEFFESEIGMIPTNMELKPLKDFFPVKTGKKNANIAEGNGKYAFFTCSQEMKRTNEYSFDDTAILLAGNGDFNVKWYRGKFEAYQRTYVLIPNDNKLFSFLYYSIDYFLDKLILEKRGSVISYMTKGMVENLKIPILKDKNKFNDIVERLNKINYLIEKNNIENKILKELRNSLLPKLMSGEIKVPNKI